MSVQAVQGPDELQRGHRGIGQRVSTLSWLNFVFMAWPNH